MQQAPGVASEVSIVSESIDSTPRYNRRLPLINQGSLDVTAKNADEGRRDSNYSMYSLRRRFTKASL